MNGGIGALCKYCGGLIERRHECDKSDMRFRIDDLLREVKAERQDAARCESGHLTICRILRAELARVDPDKLRLLADWFDCEQASGRWESSLEVQADLRKWADAIQLVKGL